MKEGIYTKIISCTIVILMIICILSLSKLTKKDIYSVATTTLHVVLVWCAIALAKYFVIRPFGNVVLVRKLIRVIRNSRKLVWWQILIFLLVLPPVLFLGTVVAKFFNCSPYLGLFLWAALAALVAILITEFSGKKEENDFENHLQGSA